MLISPCRPTTFRSSPVAVSLKSVRPVTIADRPDSQVRPRTQMSATPSSVTPNQMSTWSRSAAVAPPTTTSVTTGWTE